LTSDSGRDGGRLSGSANTVIGQKGKNSLESGYRAGKVQWTCYGPEDATWENEDAMQA
jgi:hypothetical protein